MKEIRQHKMMERYAMFLDWKAQYFENEYPTAHVQCNPYQITNFPQTQTNNLQF